MQERAHNKFMINSIFRVKCSLVDTNSSFKFLVDSGAAASIIPYKYFKEYKSKSLMSPCLYAANGQKICTYGNKELKLTFEGSNKTYKWSFIVADIRDAILGADFIAHYDMLVDCRNSKIFERKSIISNVESISTFAEIPIEVKSKLEKKATGKMVVAHRSHDTKHYIETTVEQPIAQRCRRLFGHKLQQVREHFKHLQNQGIIRPSKSPWASPLVVVRKADGSRRPCGDYRKLNDVTIPDRYPLPRIEDVLHKVGKGKIFSKIDLEKAYHQIPMNDRDINKTAIIAPFGLFEYRFMPFGLKCASQTFQRHMDTILHPVNDFCQSYVDDILVFSHSKEEHVEHVAEVIRCLNEAHMKINQAKCSFFKTAVDFLGFTISPDGIKPMEDRLKAMSNLSCPKNLKDLQKFLGTVAFYHRCIPQVATILSPLYKLQSSLKQRKTVWCWNDDHSAAFRQAKQALCDCIPLSVPDSNGLFEITTDASNIAIGASLQQKGKPLEFYSRPLTDSEKRYSTFDKELLAIFSTVKHFSYMIEGANILIKTDHKPLIHINNMKEPSQRQWRWINYLSEYKIVFEYIEGRKNIVADMLSRFISSGSCLNSLYQNIDKFPCIINVKEIQKEQYEDEDIKELVNQRKTGLRIVRIKGLFYDVSLNKPRLILTKSSRNTEIERLHSLAHPGWKATYNLISERYVWPNMRKDIRNFVKSCSSCQKNKIDKYTKSQYADLPSLNNERLAVVHIDIVGPLPSSDGFKYLLTIIDRETNWMEAIPMRTITSENVVKCLSNNWIVRFGVPQILINDQGTQFQSDIFRRFAEKMGIELRRTTAYHPQCNGKVEIFHRTLKTALRCQIDSNGGSWNQYLPWVMLGLRNTVYSNIGSPSQRLYGSNVKLPGDYFKDDYTIRDDWNSFKNIRQAIQSFPRNTRTYRRKNVYIPDKLASCSEVWLKKEVTRGMESPYAGPYTVLNRDSTNKTYVINKDGVQMRVSVDRLKPAWSKTDLE